jgi:hypothetical protein
MWMMHILLLRWSTPSGKAEAGISLPKMLQVLTPGSTIGQQDKLQVSQDRENLVAARFWYFLVWSIAFCYRPRLRGWHPVAGRNLLEGEQYTVLSYNQIFCLVSVLCIRVRCLKMWCWTGLGDKPRNWSYSRRVWLSGYFKARRAAGLTKHVMETYRAELIDNLLEQRKCSWTTRK